MNDFYEFFFFSESQTYSMSSVVWGILEWMTLMNGLPYKSGYLKITLLEETLLWLNNHIFRQGQIQSVI